MAQYGCPLSSRPFISHHCRLHPTPNPSLPATSVPATTLPGSLPSPSGAGFLPPSLALFTTKRSGRSKYYRLVESSATSGVLLPEKGWYQDAG